MRIQMGNTEGSIQLNMINPNSISEISRKDPESLAELHRLTIIKEKWGIRIVISIFSFNLFKHCSAHSPQLIEPELLLSRPQT